MGQNESPGMNPGVDHGIDKGLEVGHVVRKTLYVALVRIIQHPAGKALTSVVQGVDGEASLP